jgi:hypothetical protein
MCAYPKIISTEISLELKHYFLLLLQYLDEWAHPEIIRNLLKW